MRGDAEATYPKECCGILLGTPSGERLEVRTCRNIQDDLHAEDPGSFPRDARLAYCIDPSEHLMTIAYAEKEGLVIRGFYHSHPDRDARFSHEDKNSAIAGGEPLFPGVTYLVLSVIDAGVIDVKAFVYDGRLKEFEEQSISMSCQL